MKSMFNLPSFRNIDPVYFGLGTAVLFGCGAPLSKIMLGGISPMILAGLLYLGSGAGLIIYLSLTTIAGRAPSRNESALKKTDIPWLSGVVICGGFLAPLTLMVSLQYLAPASVALLLNFEVVMTTVLASLVFHEAVGKRVWTALLCITTACILLTYMPGAVTSISLPALGVLLACTFWALDNNFSRNISIRDPVIIVIVKGFGGGVLSITAGILLGETFPVYSSSLAALCLGFVCYGGLASVLFIMALRGLGSARAGSLLAVSPLFGGILSLVFFSIPFTLLFFAAIPVMAIGVILLLTEEHTHWHTHHSLVHEHRHRHDDLHHVHSHGPELNEKDTEGEHCHCHAHPRVTHDHPHRPDIHHRHLHEKNQNRDPKE
jgi:drug/metabolite transporter (DMT)-like permease